jgi:hypothetical protein
MNNDLALRPNNVIQSMEDVERAARSMAASGFFPDSKELSKAVVKILAGRELGFGAFASMAGVAVIQGKPVVGANLTAAAIKQTGKYNYRVLTHTDQECKIAFYEGGVDGDHCVGVSIFTMDDAKAAGLTAKDNWKKYPRNMLFARAISNGQKWYAPDVYNGVTVYTPDEMGAVVDEEGNAIEGVVTSSEVHKQTIRERYAELFNEAISLGVADTAWEVSEKMTDEEIKSLGIDLRAKVEAKKAGK